MKTIDLHEALKALHEENATETGVQLGTFGVPGQTAVSTAKNKPTRTYVLKSARETGVQLGTSGVPGQTAVSTAKNKPTRTYVKAPPKKRRK